MTKKVRVIIPAFNEEDGIVKVIRDIPKALVDEVIVVNNGSTDNTAEVAKSAGATVLTENKKGYGHACLKGISYLKEHVESNTDIVVFIDADYADYPEEISTLILPIVEEKATMVIGSRTLGKRKKGAMMPQQVFGNWLATNMIWWLYQTKYTDLGPFRAIKFDVLIALDMQDETYGWTVEMQLKAAQKNIKYVEVPVSYRPRVGKSKISGTVKGSVLAGYKIILTILKHL